MICGMLVVNKPRGPTSHDVVRRVRRAFSTRRVGHAGTLDPRAEGVLVLLLGPATRLAEYVLAQDKAYDFEVVFGIETDSLDLDGRVLRELPTEGVSSAELHSAAASLIGEQDMVPPAVSAIRKGGVRMHERARAGEPVELPPRRVVVHDLRFRGLRRDEHGRPVGLFSVECGKGTYVRSLARELAAACGTAGAVDRLVRTRAGRFGIADAVELVELEQACADGRGAEMMRGADEAVGHLPSVRLETREQALVFCAGQAVAVGSAQCVDGPVLARLPDDTFFAMGTAERRPGRLWVKPKKVLFDLREQQQDGAIQGARGGR